MPTKITKQQSDSVITYRLLDELGKIIDDAISRMEDVIYNSDKILTYDFRCLIASKILREVLPMNRSVSDDYLNLMITVEEIIKDVRKLAEKQKISRQTHKDI